MSARGSGPGLVPGFEVSMTVSCFFWKLILVIFSSQLYPSASLSFPPCADIQFLREDTTGRANSKMVCRRKTSFIIFMLSLRL